MTESRGEIFDIGYQHYTGVREGRARARKALWINGIRTSLGIGRGWMSKVLPGLLFLILMILALVFALLASTIGGVVEGIPGSDGYYEAAIVPLIIFSAIIAPEMLVADRRSGVINLYLVRPLTTTDYVVGRWLAFFSVTLALVYIPQMLLVIGLTLGAADSFEYFRENWRDIPRFIGAGVVLALFTTTMPLAAAAYTTRRAYAAVFVIGLWFITVATGNALAEAIGGSGGKWYALIDIGSVPIYINDLIFGETFNQSEAVGRFASEQPNAIIIGWYLLLVGVPGFLLWWRYRRLRL